MENRLVVSSSPHFRSTLTTNTVMRDVLIALMPAFIASIIFFGFRALVLNIVCVAACVLFEYLYRRLMKKRQTVSDLSAAVTGLLLAFNLPPTLPLWMAIIGCFVAIIVVKQLFGGIGNNFANPAIVGRIVLLLSFTSAMTTWTVPGTQMFGMDAVTGATPLPLMLNGLETPSYMQLFVGQIGGCLGETSALALLIGFVYLAARKVITVTTPVAYMATVFVLALVLGADPVFHLLSGGLMLGAIFMATDYTTSPTTEKGKIIFGIGCGIITIVLRLYASLPEGVSFAILLMNIVTPLIDRVTTTKPLGGVKA